MVYLYVTTADVDKIINPMDLVKEEK